RALALAGVQIRFARWRVRAEPFGDTRDTFGSRRRDFGELVAGALGELSCAFVLAAEPRGPRQGEGRIGRMELAGRMSLADRPGLLEGLEGLVDAAELEQGATATREWLGELLLGLVTRAADLQRAVKGVEGLTPASGA